MPVFQIRIEKVESSDMFIEAATPELAQQLSLQIGALDKEHCRMEVDFDSQDWHVAQCTRLALVPAAFATWRRRMLRLDGQAAVR